MDFFATIKHYLCKTFWIYNSNILSS